MMKKAIAMTIAAASPSTSEVVSSESEQHVVPISLIFYFPSKFQVNNFDFPTKPTRTKKWKRMGIGHGKIEVKGNWEDIFYPNYWKPANREPTPGVVGVVVSLPVFRIVMVPYGVSVVLC